jgi:hypothetical protein
MAANDEQMYEAQVTLELLANTPSDPPPVVVVPSEGGGLIKGNQAGLIRLALVALKAARGEEQKFEETWVVQDELAGTIDGIWLDNYAHYDLPKKFSRWERIRSSIILYVVVAAVAVIFVVGVQTAGYWLWRHISH